MNSEYLTSKDSDPKTAPRFDLVVNLINIYVLASILSKMKRFSIQHYLIDIYCLAKIVKTLILVKEIKT